MKVFYMLVDSSQASGDEFSDRFTVGPTPALGEKTWMNPDTLKAEWEVISTRLFRSDSGVTVCLAGLANAPVLNQEKFDFEDEPGYSESITLYFMDDQFYSCSTGGGFNEPTPELGDFIEYEGVNPVRIKPITKTVTHYETLTGDDSCRVYVAYLQPVLVPVAA